MKNKIFFIIIGTLLVCAGCKKEEIAPIAKVEVTDVLIDASYRKADVNWRVESNATAEAVVFEYSTDPTFEKAVKVAMHRVSAYYSDNPFYGVSIDSLQDGTKYYARSIVYNKINSCASAAQVFKTKPYELADISTDSITGITVSSAKLHATMREWGTDIRPQFGFCIATHDSVSIADSCIVYPLTAHKDSTAYVISLGNLTANTTYYVRAYAKNLKGVAYGEKLSFTTFEIGMPQVGNTTISDITYTTAKAASQVLFDGGSEVIERGICYSTTTNPTTANDKVSSGVGLGSFTCALSNLVAGTTYYARAYAVNSKGTSYGEQTSFTTADYSLPIVTTSSVTNISSTTATCGGNVTADGGQMVIEKGVCYSTSPNPTIVDTKVSGGSGLGIFTCHLTGLVGKTTYYIRAYATNNEGTSYGELSFFSTPYQKNLSGIFSVSDSKKVYFSSGNLQYQASTETWRFAENQYDYVGGSEYVGNVYENGLSCDNILRSSTYFGWIDLFAIGTSGCGDESQEYPPYGYVGVYDAWSGIEGSCLDWGVYNKISNGGYDINIWRTPTLSEWEYLLKSRTNAYYLRGLAIIHDVSGVIILPDDWSPPSGITWTSSTSPYQSYVVTTYTEAEWVILEQSGAVFLPNACYLNKKNIHISNYGRYWASTTRTYDGGYKPFVVEGFGSIHSNTNECNSVRLVQDVQ